MANGTGRQITKRFPNTLHRQSIKKGNDKKKSIKKGNNKKNLSLIIEIQRNIKKGGS